MTIPERASRPKRVDVTVERVVRASAAVVAAVMFDPAREPEWMKAVAGAGWLDPGPAVGARAWQKGRFLGKEIGWTTTVREHEPARRLVLTIDEGPFVGAVTYAIAAANGTTVVSVRNEGAPSAFRWMPAWLIAAAMRAAMKQDLKRLQRLVEPPARGA